MTDILNYRFPTDIALGAVGGPEFLTEITETPQGQEQRQIKRSHPRARYRISYGLKNVNQLDQVRAFYYLVKGRAYGFRYKDPLDHQVERQDLGKGDGNTKSFQLVKTYQLDAQNAYRRVITCPDEESLQLFQDGVEVENFQLQKKGKIVFREAPAPNTKITASFLFDVPVRFDSDFLAQKIEAPNAVSIDDIHLIELI